VGKHAYIGGGTVVTQDVLPYSLTSATREAHAYGMNKIGLERRGFDRPRLRALHHAFRLLLSAKMNTAQAVEKLRAEGGESEDVKYLLEFVEGSKRGIIQ
jgi:UDP-N-acetylglucosamine acyltransferase